MSDNKNNIFRQQALDRLSSPESLDKLMQVVSPKDWLPLSGLACLGALGVVWSIFGNIPITVTKLSDLGSQKSSNRYQEENLPFFFSLSSLK